MFHVANSIKEAKELMNVDEEVSYGFCGVIWGQPASSGN
jgi:hypothetical protein